MLAKISAKSEKTILTLWAGSSIEQVKVQWHPSILRKSPIVSIYVHDFYLKGIENGMRCLKKFAPIDWHSYRPFTFSHDTMSMFMNNEFCRFSILI